MMQKGIFKFVLFVFFVVLLVSAVLAQSILDNNVNDVFLSDGAYPPGSSLSVDGNGDYFNAGDVSGIEGVKEMTVEMWLNPNGWTGSYSTPLADEDGINWLLYFFYCGDIGFYIQDVDGGYNYFSSDSSIPLGNYTHVTLVLNSSLSSERTKFYINGIKQTGTATSSCGEVVVRDLYGQNKLTKATSNYVSIGALSTGTTSFNGTIDEVYFYNRSLSDAEVNNSYQRGLNNLLSNNSVSGIVDDFHFEVRTEGTYVGDADITYPDYISVCTYGGLSFLDENNVWDDSSGVCTATTITPDNEIIYSMNDSLVRKNSIPSIDFVYDNSTTAYGIADIVASPIEIFVGNDDGVQVINSTSFSVYKNYTNTTFKGGENNVTALDLDNNTLYVGTHSGGNDNGSISLINILTDSFIRGWAYGDIDGVNSWDITSISVGSMLFGTEDGAYDYDPENSAPTFDAPIPNITFVEDSYNDSLDLNDYFSDIDTGANGLVGWNCLVNTTNITLLVTNATGNFNITSGANWYGTGTANCTAIDGQDQLSNTSNNFLINVTAVNDAPVLVIDNQTTVEETNLLLNLSDYTTDADNVVPDDMTWYVQDHNVSQVECIVNSNNLTITPVLNFFGIANCLINVTDGELWDSSTFWTNVTPVNDAPILDISNQTTLEDTPFSLNLSDYTLDIDNVVPDNMDWFVYDHNISQVTCSIIGDNLTVTPTTDWNGVAFCTINVTDNSVSPSPGWDNSTFYINVTPVNDGPILNISNQTLVEDSGTTVIPFENFTTDVDNDLSDLTWNIVDQNVSAVACEIKEDAFIDGASIIGDGNDDRMISSSSITTPTSGTMIGWIRSKGANSDYGVIFGLDGGASSNDYRPAIFGDDNIFQVIWWGATGLSGNYQTSFYSFSADTWTLITVKWNATNLWIYTDKTQRLSDSFVPNGVGTRPYMFRRETATSQFWPGWLDDLAYYNRTLSEAEINIIYDRGISALYNNITQDRQAYYKFEGDFLDTMGNANLVDYGSPNFLYNGLSMTPAANFTGNTTCTINVTDPEGGVDEQTFNIEVLNVNDAPVISIPDQETQEEVPISLNLSDYTFDVDNVVPDDMTWFVQDHNVSEVSCSVNVDNLTITPTVDWNGIASCTINVTDGGLWDSSTFNINVTGVNDAPVWTAFNLTTPEDVNITNLDISGNCTDVDNLTLIFSVVENANASLFVYNITGEGLLNVSVVNNKNGFSNGTLGCSDGEYQINQTVWTNVTPVNDAPILDIPSQTMIEDINKTIDLRNYTTDVDNVIPDDMNWFVYYENASEVHCVIEGHYLNVMIPYPDWNGTAQCGVNVTDNSAVPNSSYIGWDESLFFIDVGGVNDIPIMDATVNFTTLEDVILGPYDLWNWTYDPDGPVTIWTVVDENTSQVDCEITDNNITMTPALNWFGLANCSINVTDTFGGNGSIFNIEVTSVNDLPIITLPNPYSLTQIEDIVDLNMTNYTSPYPDIEENPISWSVVSMTNESEVNCSIVGDLLNVINNDYTFGPQNCTIRISDTIDQEDYEIVFDVSENVCLPKSYGWDITEYCYFGDVNLEIYPDTTVNINDTGMLELNGTHMIFSNTINNTGKMDVYGNFTTYNNVILNGSTSVDNGGTGIIVYSGASVSMQDTILEGMGFRKQWDDYRYGIHFYETPLLFDDITLLDNNYAIWVDTGSDNGNYTNIHALGTTEYWFPFGVMNSENNTITNSEFIGDRGVYVASGTDNTRIHNNLFENMTGTNRAITLASNPTVLNAIVTNNTIRNIAETAILAHGIGHIIANNTIDGADTGIDSNGEHIIFDNNLINNTEIGMFLSTSSDNLTIMNSHIVNSGQKGIEILTISGDEHTMMDNVIENAGFCYYVNGPSTKNFYVYRDTLINCLNSDVYLRTTNLHFTDVLFDQTKTDVASNLYVYWTIDVLTKRYFFPNPVEPYVTVNWTYNNGTVAFYETSDVNGFIYNKTVLEYFENATSKNYLTNHTVYTNKTDPDLSPWINSVNVTAGVIYEVYIKDATQPTFTNAQNLTVNYRNLLNHTFVCYEPEFRAVTYYDNTTMFEIGNETGNIIHNPTFTESNNTYVITINCTNGDKWDSFDMIYNITILGAQMPGVENKTIIEEDTDGGLYDLKKLWIKIFDWDFN